MNKYHGKSKLVLRPTNALEVSKILEYCSERRLAVVPQGGNTGLVGGSVPLNDEIILSLNRMNKIHEFDSISGILTCDSGCILENLSNYLDKKGFIMPIDLGAKGSCHIGGNIATNAGGLRYVKYGSLHGSVLGLEVVTATGKILNLLSNLRKDNTGYDLKQLFIGSEGTLGIITKASILTPRKPKSIQVAFVALNSFDSVLKTLIAARTELSDIISAVEFLDSASMKLVTEHLPGARNPFQQNSPFYMLLETHGTNSGHDLEKLNGFLELILGQEIIVDGTIAQDFSQQKALWTLREGITEALAKTGQVYKYDVSLPLSKMYELVELTREQLTRNYNSSSANKNKALTVGYGHLGDGNLHLNIYNNSKQFDKGLYNTIEPWLFEEIHRVQGSISAEHGLGQAKNNYLHYSKTASAVENMKQIKQLYDPSNILNPNKVLPTK
jgi:FAD/FMN-containing dehydrogenase